MKIRNFPFAILLALFVLGRSALATTVGLSSDAVNSIYAEQKQSEWCWAACIQMITNLYGADLPQEEVVARTYGPGVNRAGTLDVITASLNGRGTDHNGRKYTITSEMLANRRLPAALVAELSAGHPVLLGCEAGGSGHAVVCTAVTYQGTFNNPAITTLTVRDPWPSASNRAGSGRQVLRGDDLGPRIMEGWIIHIDVQEADGSAVPSPRGYVFNDAGAFPEEVPILNQPLFPTLHPHLPMVATNNSHPAHRSADNNDATNSQESAAARPLVEAASDFLNTVQALLTAR